MTYVHGVTRFTNRFGETRILSLDPTNDLFRHLENTSFGIPLSSFNEDNARDLNNIATEIIMYRGRTFEDIQGFVKVEHRHLLRPATRKPKTY